MGAPDGRQRRPRRDDGPARGTPRPGRAGGGGAGQSTPRRERTERVDRGERHERREDAYQERPRTEGEPSVTEVLTAEVLDELRQTARPSAFSTASRALADAVLALSNEDAEAALPAAQAAKRAAPRSAAVRELLGIALYKTGEYRAARTELAAAQRISGDADLAAILADVERATGRPEQAIEVFRGTDRSRMSPDAAAELLIVAASAYGDLGQPDAGVALIRRNAHWPAQLADYHLRLAYAEGALAERAGDLEGARHAFRRVARTDPTFFDAAERLERLAAAPRRA